ncbi:MAG: Gfo/Idh/MocA family oxidoreductase [Firmicutes bacterium]|nr:Gfo/Idh/MocA family oxidoreductase [Bacillota bacterium]
MKRLALIGDTLVHKFIYPGHLQGFDPVLMRQLGGWMADMHADHDGTPMSPDVCLVAVASRDPSAADIARACRIERVLPDARDLSPDEVDGVLILEQDGAKHLALAAPYLAQGKFVYIDKPIALSVTDLAEMQKMALTTGARVMAGSALRYSPKLQEAAAYIKSKRPTGVTIVGPGTWYDYACHTVEALVVMLGPDIVRHTQLGSREAGTVLLEWADGLTACVLFGRRYEPLFRIHTYFTDEMKAWTIDDAAAYYRGLAQALVGAISGDQPAIAWEDAWAITRVIEEVGATYA